MTKNVLRTAYLNHDPELSRPQAAKMIGVSRVTFVRWEQWLVDGTGWPPNAKNQRELQRVFSIDMAVWQEKATPEAAGAEAG